MSNDFELVLSVNETDMKTIKNALNRVYQQGRTDMLNEIIGKCKKGFIDKVTLEFMREPIREESQDGHNLESSD